MDFKKFLAFIKKHRTAFMVIAMVILGIIFQLFNPGMAVYAATAAPPTQQYPELTKFVNFVNFIINLIRWIAGGIAGLYVTVTGWQMLQISQKGQDGLDVAKKNLKNGLWAMGVIFGGTAISSFFINNLARFLM